jgi:hypothetical protein
MNNVTNIPIDFDYGKPLGSPSANGTKYFATSDLLETARDRSWLVKMTTAINAHWQRQNARNRKGLQGDAATLAELSAA